jgi:2-phosphoglycerate kinase
MSKIASGTAEEFLLLPPREFAEVTRAWREEAFEMILDDLVALPNEKLVVEGVRLDPYLVHELADPQQIIFMIAFEGFQREHFLRREHFLKGMFQDFEDPEGVFENLMQGNALVADSMYESATELGLKILITDTKSTLAGSMEVIRSHFGL